MSYKHLSITERKKISIYRAQGLTLDAIARLIGGHQATISHELNRNLGEYSPSKAQAAYVKRRLKLKGYPIKVNYKTI